MIVNEYLIVSINEVKKTGAYLLILTRYAPAVIANKLGAIR